jgi:hypothetical protein
VGPEPVDRHSARGRSSQQHRYKVLVN